MYSYFSDRNKNNETLFSKRGSSSVPVDSVEPQAMASRATLSFDSPVSHSGTPVEVDQHVIGTPTVQHGADTLPPDVAVGATLPPGMPAMAAEPQGAAAAAPPTAEPGQAPRLDPWAESRAAAATASTTATVSEANFHRMMEFWQKVMEKQEQRIEELMKELKEKNDDDAKKPNAKTLPSIDIKDVKKPEEFDGDEKGFNLWYARFKGLLVNRHAPWKDVFNAVEKFQGNVINNQNGDHTEFIRALPADSRVAEDAEAYAVQMLAYMSSYSKGALHARVLKTKGGQIFELPLTVDSVISGR